MTGPTLEILSTYCTVRYLVGTIFGTALEWVNLITDSPHCLTVCSCVFDYPDALNSTVKTRGHRRNGMRSTITRTSAVWTADDWTAVARFTYR